MDRNGVVLVRDDTSWAVTVDRDLVEDAPRQGHRPARRVAPRQRSSQLHARTSRAIANRRSSPRVVALDVSQPAGSRSSEDPQNYPGVHVKASDRAASTRRETSPRRCSATSARSRRKTASSWRSDGYRAAAIRSVSPVSEPAFESTLRGEPPTRDHRGRPDRQPGRRAGEDPTGRGRQDRVPHDRREGATRGGEGARARHPRRAHALQNNDIKTSYASFAAPAGAVVVLDAEDGSVVALASNPDVPASGWVGGISQTRLRRASQCRRAQSAGQPGDARPVRAGLDVQARDLARDDRRRRSRASASYYTDEGKVTIGDSTFRNANEEQFGPVNLEQALTVSSDTYFYTVGNEFWNVWDSGDHERGLGIQHEARALGFGAPTGIELDEADGRVSRPGVEVGVRERQLQDQEGDSKTTAAGIRATTSSRRSVRATWSSTPLQLAERVRARSQRRHVVAAAHRTAVVDDGRQAWRSIGDATKAHPPPEPRPHRDRDDHGRAPGRRHRDEGTARRVPGISVERGSGRGQDRNRAGQRARATRRSSPRIFPANGHAVRRGRRRRGGRARRRHRGADRAPRHRGDERHLQTRPRGRSSTDGPRLMPRVARRSPTWRPRRSDCLLALPFAISGLGLLMIYSSSPDAARAARADAALLRRTPGRSRSCSA